MKKIIIVGPVLSRSGYGEMSRFAFRSLSKRSDIELFVLPTSWGNTGWLFEITEERDLIESLILKTQLYIQNSNGNPQFDISLQISIPNEWKKMAVTNIGYTAGIETNIISPAWFAPTQQMDKIIVISEHAKKSFVDAVFGNQQGQQFKVTVPIDVVHLPYRNKKDKVLELDLKNDFNFLSVCQWGPRKNLEQTIIGFLEEFKNDNVGLLLKINTANDSTLDRVNTEKRLQNLLNSYKERKCSIHLLHGHLSDEEMYSVYRNPKIKAIVSTTHGEGYGLPLMEAAGNALPVIAPDWSGHIDFLYAPEENGELKRMFGKIEHELKPIADEHVWQGVLEKGTMWAYPNMLSYKNKLRDCYKDYQRYKSRAKKLSLHVHNLLNEEMLQEKFSSLIYKKFEVESWLEEMNIAENIVEHE